MPSPTQQPENELVINLETDLCDLAASSRNGSFCIVGIGNRQRADDAVGPMVISARPSTSAGLWIDAGTTPENLLERIVRFDPRLVVLIDACDFGGEPGDIRRIAPESLDSFAISTHGGPLTLIVEYLTNRTKAQVAIIGIQPRSLAFGVPMTRAVQESARTTAQALAALPTSDGESDFDQS